MTDKKYQRFGKYLILDHLVDGGMAKICRARFLGDQANKIVAIKMVQPQYSNDPSFVKMFQDELNITFGMQHPNVNQVFDYGKTNGQLYTAMEYIHGANLKQYLDRLKDKKLVFPVEITTFIISQVCQGLFYAHNLTDKLTGKKFNIIHRDISPHNIMLTYDGAVKVIDFGIAKADTNSEATQAGTIKGKLSYLAPEYLDGLELDQRYDIFAVGITMWEMLCMRKLFQANNDLAVLKLIQQCKIAPPSQINPNVPKELDQIVMKALSKDRSARYENMDQFNRALVKFLYANYPEFNNTDLQHFSKQLFKEEIDRDQVKFVDYGKIDVQPYVDDLKKEESKTGKISKDHLDKTKVEKMRMIELQIEEAPGIELARPNGKKDPTSTKKLPGAKGKSDSTQTGIRKVVAKDRTLTRNVRKKVTKEETSTSPTVIILIIAASLAGFAYFQPEFVEEMTGINIHSLISGEDAARSISSVDNPPAVKPRPRPTPKPLQMNQGIGGEGKISLNGVDVTMEVFLDGKKVEFLGSPLSAPIGKEVRVSVKKPGFTAFRKSITLTSEESSISIDVPQLEKSRVGLLSSSLNYTTGSKLVVEVEGETIENEMPIRDLQVPVGTYSAKIVNPLLGTEKRVDFTIEENKRHMLE